MKKTLWFDVETTGLDKSIHGVIQFAGLFEIDGEIVDQINIKMQPHKGSMVSREALELNGFTMDEIKTFMPHEEGYNCIKGFFDKHIDKYDTQDKFYPAGYNVGFDIEFLQEMTKRFDKYGIGSYCNWKIIDLLSLLRIMSYAGLLDLENYKLVTVCNHYQISLNAHDALSDVIATRELAMKLIKEVIL